MPSPLQPDWDPLTALEEPEPGVWLMGRGHEEPYAVIRIVRHGDEIGYRVDTWRPVEADRKLIGYYRRLRAAAWAAQKHRAREAQAGGYWMGGPQAWGQKHEERPAAQPEG